MRMKMGLPGGLPQNVSFVPLAKLLVCTVSANQLVVFRFVLYSGNTLHPFVPVERSTKFDLTDKLTIRTVGGVVPGLTVSTNVSLVLFVPSLTVTVIVAAPVCPVTGVTVTVRFDPAPPKAIFFVGTSVKLDESWLKVRLPAAVSASPTVNAIAAVVVLTGVA